MSTHNQRLGQFGEDAAAEWYRNKQYKILDRNWRVREGEIDLICTLHRGGKGTVVFVEVKTRSSKRFGAGYMAVDWRKQKKLRQLALLWLASVDRYYDELRFDVVDVDQRGNLQVWEAAF